MGQKVFICFAFVLSLCLDEIIVAQVKDIAKLKASLTQASNDSVKAAINLKIAELCQCGDYPTAVNHVRAAALVAKDLSPGNQLQIYKRLGRILWAGGYYDESVSNLLQAKNLSIQLNDYATTGGLNTTIGLNHYYQANYDSTLYYYKLSLDIFIELNDTVSIARLYNHIGLVYDKIGDYENAIYYTLKSEELQEKTPGYHVGAYTKNFTAEIDEEKFLKDELSHYLDVLTHHRQSGNQIEVAGVSHSISRAYFHLKQFDNAIIYSRQSLKAYQQIGCIPYFTDHGEIFESMKQYDSAYYYYQKAVQANKIKGTRILLSSAYGSLGDLERKRGRYHESIRYYDLAIGLSKEMRNRVAIVRLTLAKARVLDDLNRKYEAVVLAETALTEAIDLPSPPQQRLINRFLADTYENQGNFERALYYRKAYQDINTRLSEGTSKLEMARLQLQYETEKKTRELEELQKEDLIKTAELKARNLQMLISIASFLVVLVLGLMVYARYRNKKRWSDQLEIQKKIIEEQNVELLKQNKVKETLLSEIHHRVKNNLQIISSLINIKLRSSNPETSEALKRINGRILSMGLVHEKLYQKENVRTVRLDNYLAELGAHLLESFSEQNNSIRLNLDCDPVEADIESVLVCGLIGNELLTNSMKYAFVDYQSEREISIRLKIVGFGQYELVFADNGQRANTFTVDISKSFGLRFVDQLVNTKLGGQWNIKQENGFVVTIAINIPDNGKN